MAEIVIIGGGAAGMMAAIAASDVGHNVILIEKNEKLGKKLFITGKGRCNVTNACETVDFFSNVLEHAKFLYSAVYGFDHNAVMDFLSTQAVRSRWNGDSAYFQSQIIVRILSRHLR